MGQSIRKLLMSCGAMNLFGAICLAPPVVVARRAFLLPEPDPFFLWVLASWVLAFGVAYAYQGWTGRVNRAVLALGAWGKATFAVALVGMAMRGTVSPITMVAAIPDAACAALFGWWLWRGSQNVGVLVTEADAEASQL